MPSFPKTEYFLPPDTYMSILEVSNYREQGLTDNSIFGKRMSKEL